jgi:CelD/BcsL family acetyltransferase involved in cellulose biosynthesis
MNVGTPIAEVTTQILTSREEIGSIAEAWSDLWCRCPHATSFQRPEWVLPWIDAFSPSEIRTIVVRAKGVLLGLAPLLIYARGKERVLAFMGGGVSDYLDILADPKIATEVIESTCAAAGEIPGWDTLELTDVPGDSVLVKNSFFSQFWEMHDICTVLSLPGTTDELLHMFSKRQRANLRNAHSRLRNAGEIKVEIATPDTLHEALRELIELHTSRWSERNQPGVMSEELTNKFYWDSASDLLDCGALRLYRLRLEGRTLAVIYALFDRKAVLCYLQGFDLGAAYFSPGTVLMFKVMEDAVRERIPFFDFLRGREAYKQHWRAQEATTYRITVPRPALSAHLPFAEAA